MNELTAQITIDKNGIVTFDGGDCVAVASFWQRRLDNEKEEAKRELVKEIVDSINYLAKQNI